MMTSPGPNMCLHIWDQHQLSWLEFADIVHSIPNVDGLKIFTVWYIWFPLPIYAPLFCPNICYASTRPPIMLWAGIANLCIDLGMLTTYPQCNFILESPAILCQNLSLTECVWEFRNNALWNTHKHALLSLLNTITDKHIYDFWWPILIYHDSGDWKRQSGL